jgi:hypothetical protein
MREADLEDRIREIEATLLALEVLFPLVLAERAESNTAIRTALEDVLSQAIAARPVHVPLELGDVLPDVHRIIRDLLERASQHMAVPLQPSFFEEEP